MSSSCWQEGPRRGETSTEMGIGSTCMLVDGHDGEHEFTPDDAIMISLAEPECGISCGCASGNCAFR